MIFTFETAKRVSNRYSFLLQEYIADVYPINRIVIAPVNDQDLKESIRCYQQGVDNDSALRASGYDPEKVQILVAHIDQVLGGFRYVELDSYLSENNLKKRYS